MLEAENSEIWPIYATPYSTFLVEQFCLFLSFAPEYDLTDHYIPESQFTQVWEESKDDILSTYLRAHFEYCPQVLDYTLLIDTCIVVIHLVTTCNNKTHDSQVIRTILQGISQRLCKFHQDYALRLEQEDNELESDEEGSEEEELDEESKRRQERLQTT